MQGMPIQLPLAMFLGTYGTVLGVVNSCWLMDEFAVAQSRDCVNAGFSAYNIER